MKSRPTLAFLLLIAAACRPGQEEPDRLSVLYRLVDPELRAGAETAPPELITRDVAAFPSQTSRAARIPRASIGDDSRHVLTGFDQAPLTYRTPARLDAEGRLRLALPVPASLRDASALVLVSQLRTPDREAWQRPRPALVPVEKQGQDRVGRLQPTEPLGAPGSDVEVITIGLRPSGRRSSYTTRLLEIPSGARLELSMGVLPAAAAEGPVRFTLEACEAERCRALLSEDVDPASPLGRAWLDRSVELDALAGTTRRLRFRTEHLPGGGDFTLPVWGDPVLLAPALAADPRPNLILLSIDTLRRDHLDLYGYSRATAPFLRGLGAEGVVFDGFVAEAATTDPSHMTMFTSLPTEVHGVRRLLEPLEVPVTTLAEALRDAGYRTAAFTEDGPLAHERGFAIGFDAYRENKSASVILPAGHVEDTFRQAREWLGRNGDRPFFLFLHTFQVHAPYAPPAAYAGLFGEPEPAALSPAQRRTIADYDREIRYVDDQLAELVRFADERGRGADTIWVVLSDHGEEFWEHGSLGHATLPYEEVLRVPLVVRGPGVLRGARRPDALHHLDLMPTLLELAGAAPPPEARGRSFASLLREDAPPGAPARPRTLVSAAWVLPDGLAPPAFAVRSGSDKLIRWRDAAGVHELLFDLARDPAEQTPAAGPAPRLRDGLAAHRVEIERARAALVGPEGAPRPAGAIPLDPEREAVLRSLGYIE
jgi:arylsulfatase A-like enzyme